MLQKLRNEYKDIHWMHIFECLLDIIGIQDCSVGFTAQFGILYLTRKVAMRYNSSPGQDGKQNEKKFFLYINVYGRIMSI